MKCHQTTNVPDIRLGFGCGSVYADQNHADWRTAIDAAYASGIRWFDTARLYGHGGAESILGKALRGKRAEVTLVSKAGILPSQITLAHKVHGKLSALSRRIPVLPSLPAPAPIEPEFGVFAPKRLRASVETSLRQLGTDWLDLLMLHECTQADANAPEVIDLLQALQKEGKIRAYGTATNKSVTRNLAANASVFSAHQFELGPFDEFAHEIASNTSAFLIGHSVLSKALPTVMQALDRDPVLRARVEASEAGIAGIGPALLAAAAARNPIGVVLFSSMRKSRVEDAVAAFKDAPEQTDQLLQILRPILA